MTFGISYNSLPGLILSIVFLVVTLLFAASVEEIIFRGYIQKTLVNKYGTRVGLIVASLIFMLAHIGLNPELFFAGLVLGILYIMTRSVWMSIGFHFLYNLVISVTPSYNDYLSFSYPLIKLSSFPVVPYVNDTYVYARAILLIFIFAGVCSVLCPTVEAQEYAEGRQKATGKSESSEVCGT